MHSLEILHQMYHAPVMVFGHRGAKAYAPMNTIPAFELALQQGAHGIELDVHRSKDGHLVIVHDFTVDSTSDGKGTVTDMTLADLKSLDAGSWFSPEFVGVRIPTLDEVFEAVGKHLIVNVEIKSMGQPTGAESLVVDCIKRHQMEQRVIISSFDPMVLKRLRPMDPDLPLGFLISPDEMSGKTQALLNVHEYDAHHPHESMIDASRMHWVNSNQQIVNTWTVNDPERAKELVVLGVRGLITDAPDVILKAIQA